MSGSTKRVLFVDDNPQFLDLTREIMSRLAGASWEIHTAQNVGQAMNMIAEKQIDLVVLDVLMPVVDGMQFLSLLNRKHPNVLKAVLTGDSSEMHRTICMSRGAELFLPKPQGDSEWHVVFDSLNSIGRLQPQEGFRGVLRRVGLQDVLQMECLSRNSALLEITTKELRGLIYIFEGQIIHAEAGDRSGPEAFNFLMGLTGGEFAQKPFVTPTQRTITDSWEFLLMEAARQRDETFGPDDPIISETPVVPQFRSAGQPVAAPQKPAGPQWQPPAAPALPQPRRPAPPRPTEPQTNFFTRPPAPNAADTQRPEVTEFVVFSSQGDLIYEWQCPDSNARINFLEFLSQKTRQLGQGLPMGHFERFEVFGSKSRIITQIENDHAVFVRSNVAPDNSVVGDHA
ncbi:MAG TPA: response regulator [Verrucomicrobiae bacterium]|nr:response regulator [Verrucomicrobiae bacterium]